MNFQMISTEETLITQKEWPITFFVKDKTWIFNLSEGYLYRKHRGIFLFKP